MTLHSMDFAASASITVSGVIALAGAIIGFRRWVAPRWRSARDRKRSIEQALLGAPAIPANPITGTKEREEIVPLGKRIADLTDQHGQVLEQLAAMTSTLNRCVAQLEPNHGSSMHDRITRTEETQAVVGHVLVELARSTGVVLAEPMVATLTASPLDRVPVPTVGE